MLTCRTYVVDDDAAIRDAMQLELRSYGIDAQAFTSGLEFLAGIDALEPGCVLLDLTLPGDGLATLRKLIAHPSRFRAVIITGQAEEDQVKRAVDLGAVTCLRKPFPAETLIEAINEACAQIGQTK